MPGGGITAPSSSLPPRRPATIGELVGKEQVSGVGYPVKASRSRRSESDNMIHPALGFLRLFSWAGKPDFCRPESA